MQRTRFTQQDTNQQSDQPDYQRQQAEKPSGRKLRWRALPHVFMDWWSRQYDKRAGRPTLTAFVSVSQKLSRDHVPKLAAMLAYYLLMALVPILVMLLSIFGMILDGLVPHAQQYLVQELSREVPGARSLIALAQHRLIRGSLPLTLISTLVSAYFGARLFVTIEYCFDRIFRVPERHFLRKWLTGLGMLVLFVLVIPVLLVVSALPSFLSTRGMLVRFAPVHLTALWVWLLSAGVSWGMAFVLFLVIYAVMPNRKRPGWQLWQRYHEAWKGAAIAAALLTLYLIGFPLYAVRYVNTANDATTAAMVLLVLVFFYFFGFILLLGAEITSGVVGCHPARKPVKQNQSKHPGLAVPEVDKESSRAAPALKQSRSFHCRHQQKSKPVPRKQARG